MTVGVLFSDAAGEVGRCGLFRRGWCRSVQRVWGCAGLLRISMTGGCIISREQFLLHREIYALALQRPSALL